MDIIEFISVLLIILTNGLAGIITAKFTRLPLTLCVLLWGIVSSVLIPLSGIDTGIRADTFQDLIMFTLIPVLVFEAALNLHLKALRPLLATTLTAATLGIILATLIAGAVLYYAIGHPSGFPWIAALLAGLVISATDPVAVVSQLKTSDAPPQLATLIEGESLFNDATALVLFSILLMVALSDGPVDVSSGLIEFVTVFVGGLVVGAALALLVRGVIRLMPKEHSYVLVASLVLAYGSFFIAEHVLHVSGVMATLVAALIIKKDLMFSTEVGQRVHLCWDMLALLSNLVVFYLMGLVFTFDMFSERWLAMLFGILAAFLSRLVSAYVSVAAGKWVFGNTLCWNYAPVMVWGGLRGVITLALVLSLPVELEYWWTIQSIGFGVVLFTLVVQATSNPWLLRKLKFTPA